MKKRIISVAIIMLLIISSTVFATSASQQITVVPNQIKVTADGAKITADNFLYKGTTYVPIRAVAEAFDKTVSYDSATETATITSKDGDVHELSMNATTADIYFNLYNASQSVYDMLNQLLYLDFTANDIESQINQWALLQNTIQSNVNEQKAAIAKYKAAGEYYQTSLLATGDIIDGFDTVFNLFGDLKTAAVNYAKNKTNVNNQAVVDIYSRISSMNSQRIYYPCLTLYHKYMAKITE